MIRGASSEATGGIGSTYERATAAVYLAALLTDSAGPGLTGPVRHVGAQQKAALDDLEIGFDAGHGQTGLLRLQLKHDLKLTDSISNDDFAAIVADSWHVLLDRHFQHGVDRVGAAAEKIAAEAYYAAMKLGELARLALDGETLKARVEEEAQRSKAVFAAVTALSRRALDRLPTADELLTFWRHFDVLRIETVMVRHDGRLRAIDSLRSLVTATNSPAPATVFAALEAVAGTLNVRSATLDRDRLLEELAEVHGLQLQPVDPQLEPTARTAAAAAAKDAQAWRDHFGVQAVAPIFAPRDPIPAENADAGPGALGPAFGLDGVEAALRDHRGIAILGAPGAGKTQSLIQIAEHLLKTSTLIPIVHSLPKLALRKAAILDAIAAEARWREIAQTGLGVLAGAGRLVLLLDGWNELGTPNNPGMIRPKMIHCA